MRHLLERHRARPHRREAVVARPLRRAGLAVDREVAGGEGLEQHARVDEELVADGVEIVHPPVDRQVPPPVVGVALEGHEAPRLEGADHVRPGADRHPQAARLEIDPLPVGLLQDRPEPDDQRQLGVGLGEGEADRPFAGLLDARHLFPCVPVSWQPMFSQGLHRPDHVLDRHRAAVGEAGLRPQREFHPFAIRPGLDRLGQQAVEPERLVPVARHQRLEDVGRHRGGRTAAEDVRIERIEAPGFAEDDGSALGRLRVRIGQRHKIRWQGRLAIHSYAMHGLGQRRDRRESGGDERQQRRPSQACHIRHSLTIDLPWPA